MGSAVASLQLPSAPSVLVYTWRTTGRPKGALLKQSGLVCDRVAMQSSRLKRIESEYPSLNETAGSACTKRTLRRAYGPESCTTQSRT